MSFFLNSFNFKVIVPSVGTGFVIQIDTTKAGSTTSTQFNLALRSSTNYDFNIDWGDGVIESYTSSNTTGYTHTYPSSGIYTVSIGERTVGGFPRVYYNNTGDRLKLLKIAAFGSNQFGTDWNGSFNGCNNLVIIATDGSTAKTNNVTNFSNAWYNCTSLSSFPLIDTSKGTNFDSAWYGCDKLKDFPLIDTSKTTSLDRTWANCTSLTAFPLINTTKITSYNRPWQLCRGLLSFPLIDTLSATNLTNTWENCEKLTTFPLINTSNVISFNTTWSQCISLSSFPLIDTSKATTLFAAWQLCSKLNSFPLLNTSNVTNFSYAWSDCISLSSFPLIDTSKGTNFSNAWYNCNKLTSFPLLNTLSGTNFSNAWYNCNKLTSFPLLNTLSGTNFSNAWFYCTSLSSFPLIDTSKGTDFSNAWRNCTSLSSFPLIDTSKGTNFSATWYNCTSLSSFPLIDTSKATRLDSAWENCYSLFSFPYLETSACNNFERSWYNCINLRHFPYLNFKQATDINYMWAYNYNLPLSTFTILSQLSSDSNLTDIGGVFIECTQLREFPFIDTRKVVDAYSLCSGCTQLTSFPAITLSAAVRLMGAWANCTSLSSFPYIDISNAIDLGQNSSYSALGAWQGCSSLATFPILNTGKVTNFSYAWYNCNKLTSFPLLNTLSGTNFSYAWSYCTSLNSFPLIDTSKGTDFSYAWFDCISLSASDFPTLNMSKMTNGISCFEGVKLTTTSYSSMLTSLCATNFNTLVTFHGGDSTYNLLTPQVSAARTFLTTSVANGGRGWTIADGGAGIPFPLPIATPYWYTDFESGTVTKTNGYASSSDVVIYGNNGTVVTTQPYQGTRSYYCNSRTLQNNNLSFGIAPSAFNSTDGFVIDFMVYKVSGDNFPTMLAVGLSSTSVNPNSQIYNKNYYYLRWLGTNYGSGIQGTGSPITNSIISNNTSWGSNNKWHRITYYFNNKIKYGVVYVDGIQTQIYPQTLGWNTLPDGKILIGLFNFGTEAEASDNGIEAYIDNLGFYTI